MYKYLLFSGKNQFIWLKCDEDIRCSMSLSWLFQFPTDYMTLVITKRLRWQEGVYGMWHDQTEYVEKRSTFSKREEQNDSFD